MSSFSSVWSRTMSTMTRSTTDTSTSAPHTPSSSSVITGLKAALGSGSFFHAHLQEGQRFSDEASSPDGVRYEVSAYAIGPNNGVTPGAYPRKPNKAAFVREEQTHVSTRHGAEKPASGALTPLSSSPPTHTSLPAQAQASRSPVRKWTRSASATAMSSDNQGVWEMLSDTQAVPSNAAPTQRRYHYITRSQSADAAADAVHLQQAPKMRKQNASYSPGFSAPIYSETAENIPAGPGAPSAWCPSSGRYLSPIEEVQSCPEKQVDSASLHSTTSAQSNLFIHRSVRRTGSTSTFNSSHSAVSRTLDDLSGPHSISPSRTHGQARPFPALPVIPASPRESQNVFEQDQAALEEATLVYPMPVDYPQKAEYPEFDPPEEQDLGGTLSTPRFAIPHYHFESDTVEEQDLGEGLQNRVSIPHSRTPSLLTRSESIRTELTYLTAQDSAASRRASAVPPGDLEAGQQQRSQPLDGDTTLVDSSTKGTNPAARLKASLDTLLSKSPKMRKSPGPGSEPAAPDVASTVTVSSKAAKLFAQLQEGLKNHAPWREGKGKPAEVLFWVGFLAPWCWLIGGWMLARSGGTRAEGLPSGAKESVLPLYNRSSSQPPQRQSQDVGGLAVADTPEKRVPESISIWRAAKNSSVELLGSLRGHREKEGSPPSTVRAVQLRGDVPVQIMVCTHLDPWVTRCRVAAIVSGMFILALCIVALVVLARSL
ncbi:uncharacterized protein FOMMEDRAFT_168586 [Fomitiporia mediterranea MF3/22]|uniref:uncharacterized protein n=1 Tax=Fomitiporia mediterranea (strain MF3/22) TaxID=694068 RepID=UPI0004408684|nr:uncharacterized protein FOMMEDRAFT_168586 [Fomitiporia mediterranea MF3/22]EJD02025.1 hypothetical protein FOMMEDRAFT_168586 [Fomitiporia mediterranea MF3/22]